MDVGKNDGKLDKTLIIVQSLKGNVDCKILKQTSQRNHKQGD
jgi:hypothetical protein